MILLGHIAELWRYPVKSMQGELCHVLTLGPVGVDGDRRFAFESQDAPVGKPLLRFAQRSAMVRVAASTDADGNISVRTSDRLHLPLDHARPHHLGIPDPATDLDLRHADRPFTDVRPISLHALATVAAIAAATPGFDGRSLRSNIVLDLGTQPPFAEDALAGKLLQLGETAQLAILERIPRCRMVSLHPETATADDRSLRWLARHHQGRAGIYARSRQAGTIAVRDPVFLLD